MNGLAYYQYWLGAKVVQGPMKDAVIAELLLHAADELRHADMVTARIIQLGGTPITSPLEWFTWANCGYAAPDDPFVKKILEQNIAGEQCAINVYNSIIGEIGLKDPVTYNLAVQILQDEVEHEEDLQALLRGSRCFSCQIIADIIVSKQKTRQHKFCVSWFFYVV